MATEPILMMGVRRGGDRQELHERIRQHSIAAANRIKDEGGENDLVDRIANDPAFGLTREEIEEVLDPARHVGRAPEQVDAFLEEEVYPTLARYDTDTVTPELKV